MKPAAKTSESTAARRQPPSASAQAKSYIVHPLDLPGVVRFSNSLAVMLGAGMGIVKALEILASSDENPVLADGANRMADAISKGISLSKAAELLEGTFDQVYVRMLMAGESSGELIQVLRGLADDAERRHRQMAALKQALVYPFAILGISMAMGAFMVYYMLPKFLGFFDNFGTELPLPTKILMFVVFQPVIRYGVPVAVLVAVMGHFGFRHQQRMQAIQEYLKYRAPLLGRANRLMVMSQFCNNLRMMGESGIALVEALKLLSRGTGYHNLDEAVARVRERIVQDGSSFGGALDAEEIFPPMVVQSVIAAEEGSDLYGSLGHASKLLSEEAEAQLDALLPILEPLIMGVMGLLVGFIVLATFLPIYQLTTVKI